MGLPVHQIIATLEEQMLGSNDDEDGGDWNEEDEGTKDFSGVEVELMDGDNAGSKYRLDRMGWTSDLKESADNNGKYI